MSSAGWVFWARTPEDEDLADTVDGGGGGAFAEFVADGDTIGTVVRADSHLDQFVRCERAIDFGDERFGEAGAPGLDHWFERMRPGFEMGALSRGQVLGHGRIVPLPEAEGLGYESRSSIRAWMSLAC